MKKILFLTWCLLPFILSVFPSVAQNYDVNRLKTLADIWGEAYLFHPSVVRADQKVSWEQELISFLPSIKGNITEDEFAERINKNLLPALGDRFTRMQSTGKKAPEYTAIPASKEFDYLRLNESQLADIGYLQVIDSLLGSQDSKKPLVIDVRISRELNTDYHTNTLFDYFISMFLTEPLPLSQRVSREHFGWDEWNDWWFYEQRWKVSEPDRQLADCSVLKPLPGYAGELSQYLPEFDLRTFTPVQRPLYFITNNSFLSYYGSLIDNLAARKPDVHVLHENTGLVYTPVNSGLISYPLSPSRDFILNTSFYLTNGQLQVSSCKEYDRIDQVTLEKELAMQAAPQTPVTISLAISPARYESSSPSLSMEEKILGMMKLRTVLKHFHRDNRQYAGYLDQAFDKYTGLALTTETDKAYYELIREMTAPLNDSHISIFHPSIVDFSAMFTAPVYFEWIENKMVITAVKDGVTECQAGDVISAVDHVPVSQILEKSGKQISHSNRQGLLATVIHPGNFVGQQGSDLTLEINGKDVALSRTVPVWELMNPSGNKASGIYEGNVGYLNLALQYDAADIQEELKKMQHTQGLIIDLRNSYPAYDFYAFLRMLCPRPVTVRIAEVPVVAAGEDEVICIQRSRCTPDPDFTYKGKIAVLTDKTMISRPEDIAIALSAIPHVIFIGGQTQGTDGEVSKIHLPGNGEVAFTGQRIRFGNGKDFHRTGITPDIRVEGTIQGVKDNRDEVFERALEYMGKNSPEK